MTQEKKLLICATTWDNKKIELYNSKDDVSIAE
jgi:hypothetical protein